MMEGEDPRLASIVVIIDSDKMSMDAKTVGL